VLNNIIRTEGDRVAAQAKAKYVGCRVRTTTPFVALLNAVDDEDQVHVVDADGNEILVPMSIGTVCEIIDVSWIGGEQGMGFYIVPIGSNYPDADCLQIDDADLDNGLYPFLLEMGIQR